MVTKLHEHAHWAGHKSRLNRDLTGRFGDQAYAGEELVAELTTAFLAAELQIPGELRHPEYIAAWLKVFGNDTRARRPKPLTICAESCDPSRETKHRSQSDRSADFLTRSVFLPAHPEDFTHQAEMH